MECNECKKRPATLLFTQIINGNKSEIQVCEPCAKKLGYMKDNDMEGAYSLHDLLTGLFNFSSPQIDLQNNNLFNVKEELECPKCNITFTDFKRIGKFGCAQCYDTFRGNLETVFRRVHSGNTKHHGKIPKRKGKNLHAKRELETYRIKLQQLIEQEEFEQAAVVRDEIKRLEDRKEGEHS